MPEIKRQSPKPTIPPKKTTGPPTQTSSARSAWDFDEDGIKVALYGQSGTGKTTLWATFPGPIRAIIVSGGKKAGELRSINKPEYKAKIDARYLDSVAQFKSLTADTHGWKKGTVVIDHATGLQDLALKEILGIDELPEQKGWGLATQQQWGQATAQTKELLRSVLNLSINVVIIGQERVFNGREDGVSSEIITPTVGIAVTPSLAGWLNPACDYLMQTFKRPKMRNVTTKIGAKDHVTQVRDKGVEYCLRCEAHDIFMTKFRLPKGSPLPDVIVDPSYDKILAVINGTYKP